MIDYLKSSLDDRTDIKISALCPTRGRPNQMEELTRSLFDNVSDETSIEVIFYIDNDDHDSLDKAGELKEKYNISYVNGNRIVLSQMWNKCYEASNGEILFHCGDDIRMRTKDWDKIVINKIEEFEDRIAFVYGADGHQPKTFGTHGFVHKNWVNVIGYFVPPYFSSDYNDTWLNEVSQKINRHFFVDIYTEHLHPETGKAVWDKTHKDRLARGAKDNVGALYNSLKMNELRDQDAERLRKFIKLKNEV